MFFFLGKKDGTFLVRDSTSNMNDYTLTVKKDGINKMMRMLSYFILYRNDHQFSLSLSSFSVHLGILCINNKYGFRTPPQFDSLQSLIEYHTKNSLAEYYPEMDLRLDHSLSKSDICSALSMNSKQIDVELLSEKLKMANDLYIELTQEYDNYHQEYKSIQDEIMKFRQSLNCFEETFAIFDEQLKLNEENQKDAMVHEKADIAKHYDHIRDKLEEIKEFRKQLELQCEEKNSQSTILDRKINELKPLLNEKKRYREQIKAILINKIGNDGIERILEFSSDLSCSNLFQINKAEFNSDNYDPVHSQKLNYCQIDKEYLVNAYQTAAGNSQFSSPTSETNPLNSSMDGSMNHSKSRRNETTIVQDSNDQSEGSAYLDLEAQSFAFDAQSSLVDAEWYVGDLSKEDVNIIMKSEPDGTFIVRDSKNRVEAPFTLTVRVNGSSKMIRILKSDDGHYYGFKPDKLEFDSVVKLIEYYLKEPLIVFKPDLTIRLLYPMNKDQIRNRLH